MKEYPAGLFGQIGPKRPLVVNSGRVVLEHPLVANKACAPNTVRYQHDYKFATSTKKGHWRQSHPRATGLILATAPSGDIFGRFARCCDPRRNLKDTCFTMKDHMLIHVVRMHESMMHCALKKRK